jgi:hypothetical protein
MDRRSFFKRAAGLAGLAALAVASVVAPPEPVKAEPKKRRKRKNIGAHGVKNPLVIQANQNLGDFLTLERPLPGDFLAPRPHEGFYDLTLSGIPIELDRDAYFRPVTGILLRSEQA